jgi:membrane protein required for colicin V production
MLDEIESLVAAIGNFNLYDWFIVVIWVISLGYGLVRGFAREALSILGWISAFLAANVLVEAVANLMSGLIDDPTTRFLLGWIIIFIAVLLMFGVIAAFLSKQMRQPGFHLGNRGANGSGRLGRGVGWR